MTLILTAQQREVRGKRTNALRKHNRIPAVVYGHTTSNIVLEVNEVPFRKVWKKAGESSLIDLKIGEADPVKAIIQDIQFEPASGKILHVDFHQVNMKEKVDVTVELHLEGESPAVKELGGTLVKDHDAIDVQCLPQDLVKEIPVHIGVLKTFDDVLRVRDLALPKGLELITDPENIIAHVEAPRTEAELAELDQTVEEDVTKVEKVEKEEKEEEVDLPTEEPAKEAKS
ncbi:MAG: 50S ribosomal protein L25 [bacterium]